MAKNVRIRFNQRRAFRDLRREPGVVEDLRERATRVAEAAGDGVNVLPQQTFRERAHFVVAATDPETDRKIAKDNTLIRALEAGR